MNMTDEEFNRIFYFLKSRYGIDLTDKKDMTQKRLVNFVKNAGYRSYNAYMDAVEADKTGQAEKKLVNKLTTNHTYFMREFEHFEYMKSTVLPYVREKAARTKDISIWCGASSTGEEPYMIAMLLRDFFGLESDQWDTKVLATDISTEVLQQAVAGIYTGEQIESLPDMWKRRYLKRIPGQDRYQVVPEIRQEVIFRKFNLMDNFPFKRRMDVIFLRNVMIYFDVPTKQKLVRKLYDALEPGGYLFIGQTETLDKTAQFQLVRPSIYRK